MEVSEISLGTWLSCDNLNDKADSIGIIDTAYAHGINFFDTANVYSSGRAEVILGEALRRYPRASYVVATKVYWPLGEGPDNGGLSRRQIFKQVHDSLKRLGLDYVDCYYCHWFDIKTPIEETMRAMDDLVHQGKILYIGVSNWTAAQISRSLRIADSLGLNRIVVNQPSYNMFDRYIEQETMPLCEVNGIGQVVYSPLAQGLLTGKYRRGVKPPRESRAANPNAGAAVTVWDYMNDDLLEKVERLEVLAKEMGITLPQLALAWVLAHSNVTSALTGASKPHHVVENVEASGLKLPLEIIHRIDALSVPGYTVKHNVVQER